MKNTNDMMSYKENSTKSTKTLFIYEWLQQYDKLQNHYINVTYTFYILIIDVLKTLFTKYLYFIGILYMSSILRVHHLPMCCISAYLPICLSSTSPIYLADYIPIICLHLSSICYLCIYLCIYLPTRCPSLII